MSLKNFSTLFLILMLNFCKSSNPRTPATNGENNTIVLKPLKKFFAEMKILKHCNGKPFKDCEVLLEEKYDKVTEDLLLPTDLGEGVTAEWSVDKTSILDIPTDSKNGFKHAKIHRQLQDQDFELSVTLKRDLAPEEGGTGPEFFVVPMPIKMKTLKRPKNSEEKEYESIQKLINNKFTVLFLELGQHNYIGEELNPSSLWEMFGVGQEKAQELEDNEGNKYTFKINSITSKNSKLFIYNGKIEGSTLITGKKKTYSYFTGQQKGEDGSVEIELELEGLGDISGKKFTKKTSVHLRKKEYENLGKLVRDYKLQDSLGKNLKTNTFENAFLDHGQTLSLPKKNGTMQIEWTDLNTSYENLKPIAQDTQEATLVSFDIKSFKNESCYLKYTFKTTTGLTYEYGKTLYIQRDEDLFREEQKKLEEIMDEIGIFSKDGTSFLKPTKNNAYELRAERVSIYNDEQAAKFKLPVEVDGISIQWKDWDGSRSLGKFKCYAPEPNKKYNVNGREWKYSKCEVNAYLKGVSQNNRIKAPKKFRATLSKEGLDSKIRDFKALVTYKQ